jgi:hypothetical protein
MIQISDTPKFYLIEFFELDNFDRNNVDAIETYPCATFTGTGEVDVTEQCGPDEAQFYSVFFHSKTDVPQRIADCADSKTASHLAKCLARILDIDF